MTSGTVPLDWEGSPDSLQESGMSVPSYKASPGEERPLDSHTWDLGRAMSFVQLWSSGYAVHYQKCPEASMGVYPTSLHVLCGGV